MKTTLLWTINDFLAYGIVSRWSTHGKLTYLYSVKNNKAFTLMNDDKTSFFFYCYRRFLPRHHQYRKNQKNFLKCKAEKIVVLLVVSN
jgi:hypothetical protein